MINDILFYSIVVPKKIFELKYLKKIKLCMK